MDDTFSVDMLSPSLDQFVFILIPDMQKANELAQMYFLARKNKPKNELRCIDMPKIRTKHLKSA